ncbi:MAG: glycosyltransferase family 4 protein [Flavobacteriales bacterium]|nr:glycosyltransferase family 4 protein [Flavobacteriales bacterium]
MDKVKKVVGYVHKGYNEKRNSFGLETDDFRFDRQQVDVFKFLDYLYFKTSNRTSSTLHNFHLNFGKCDLFHFFNGVSLGSKPWVTTFETSLPRVGANSSYMRLGVDRLNDSSCKQLIALSQNAYEIQSNYLEGNFPHLKQKILGKTTVLHPPQDLIINSYSEKKLETALTFTLIGADFFRKGGMETLEVFDYLLSKKYNIKLNIVSSMQYGDYATKTNKQDQEKALKLIAKHSQNINHYNSLPNTEVIKLLVNSHVGLLPTYADTYGYSVLESQACGCPVISTNIRALPEINNNEIGYQINVPKTENGGGNIFSVQDRASFSSTLREHLQEIITGIVNNPDKIREKGIRSLKYIKENHSPLKHAEIRNEIYLNALV